MNNFDLNINNYNVDELIEILQLSIPYDKMTIISNKNNLKEKITTQEELNINKKNEIYDFLDKVSEKIINESKKENFSFSIGKNIISNDSHALIQNTAREVGLSAKDWEGRLIDNSEQPPGYINPINVRTITKTINIDTRFRPQYYNTSATNYTFTLPLKINNVISMRIASIEIPITWYSIALYNDNSYFKIEWGDYYSMTDTYQYSGLVMIPDGNYECFWQNSTQAADISSTINSFLHGLNSLDALGNNGNELIQNIIFNVDRISGRSGFAWNTTSNVAPQQFRVSFAINSNGEQDNQTVLQFKLGWSLGFRIGTYTGKSIVSEGIFYIKNPRYCFISIKDFNNSVNNYFYSAFSSSLLNDDIMTRVNLQFIQQNQGVYQSGQDDGLSTQLNRKRSYFGPVDIEKLEIKLLDEYGKILNLNNMDWSMVLTMECIYNN